MAGSSTPVQEEQNNQTGNSGKGFDLLKNSLASVGGGDSSNQYSVDIKGDNTELLNPGTRGDRFSSVNADDRDKDAGTQGITQGVGSFRSNRALNFTGGGIDENSGNVIPANSQFVKGGHTVTTPGVDATDAGGGDGSRFGSVTAEQSDTGVSGVAPPTPIAAPQAPSNDSGGGLDFATIALGAIMILCHTAGTRIKKADGSWINVEDIDIGMELELGGMVLGVGKALCDDIWNHNGAIVSGSHAVFEEDIGFVRVRDSEHAVPVPGQQMVFPVVTESHLLVSEYHVSADMAETDFGANQTDEERIRELNDTKAALVEDYLENQKGSPVHPNGGLRNGQEVVEHPLG